MRMRYTYKLHFCWASLLLVIVRDNSGPYHEVTDTNFNILSSMDRSGESIDDPIELVEHKFSWSSCGINQYELER